MKRILMTVSIPHDWAVKGPFDKDIDKQVVAIEQNGERNATEKTGRTGSLPWIGEGWYRTEITKFLPRNGSKEEHLASGTHTLAVHLQNIEESARWYPGAGIYRPVRLVLHPQNYLKTWGTFARTTMVSGISADATMAQEARLYITSEAVIGATLPKGKKLRVRQSLVDAQGNVVAKSEEEAGRHESIHVLTIQNAHLWSPEAPRLYTLVTELIQDNEVCDRMETFRRQVRLLKDIGCDAIRTSHNMPAPWQMDICDEMGMMVMAESFDIRNHPSIVMWSIGNEIPEQGTTVGLDYTRKLQDLVHRLDGLPKDRVWLYRTHWAPEKQTLHLLPHWTWPGREGQNTPVFCYTNYPEAELFVNGKSMGRIRHTDLTLDEYEAHRIEAPMPWGGTSTEVFTNPTMKAFHGQLVIVLQSTAQSGVSTLTVKGKGLKGGKIDIKTI